MTIGFAFFGVLLGIVAVDVVSAVVLFRLHRLYRLPYLRFWAWSWLSHGIYQGAAAVSVQLAAASGSGSVEPLRLFVSATGFAFGYGHVMALYLGIQSALGRLSFSSRTVRSMLLASFGVGVLLVLASGGLARDARFLVRLGPLTLIGALVLVAGAVSLLRASRHRPDIENRLVAYIFAAFAFVRFVHFAVLLLRYGGISLPPQSMSGLFVLSVMDLVLEAGMAFGLVIWFLEIERENVVSTERRLRQAQRLEAVGLLAGGIAHDFNNTLTVVLGYLELIKERLAEGRTPEAEVDEAVRAARRGASLTQQLLSFSRRHALRKDSVNLNEVVSELWPMLGRLMPENIELSLALASNPDAGHVKTDVTQLEQVIVNLILNARDAMPEGGRLVISTRRCASCPDENGEASAGSFAVLSVADTGVGMSGETAARVFDPFFTTKPFGKGTGLGLSVAYGFSMQSGGAIEVHSQPSSGTRVDVYLPLTAASPAETKAPPLEADGGSATILVVEDDPSVRELVRRVLSTRGYEVVVAEDGQDALDLWSTREGEFTLLVTDVRMPRLGGKELARMLRGERPGLAVLFMSGHTGGERLLPDRDDKSVAFLQKPFSPQKLCVAVRELLDAVGMTSSSPSRNA